MTDGTKAAERGRAEGIRFAQEPPAWLRKLEVALLLRVFARAYGVEAPRLRGTSAGEALYVFREFTAACMELALRDKDVARYLRGRLGTEAYDLGSKVRRTLKLTPCSAIEAARYLYRGIGIELAGQLPGELAFGPCSFAQRYTPQDCWLMSAFDQGFLRGISGSPQADLVFSERLTQGAPCCRACFGHREEASHQTEGV